LPCATIAFAVSLISLASISGSFHSTWAANMARLCPYQLLVSIGARQHALDAREADPLQQPFQRRDARREADAAHRRLGACISSLSSMIPKLPTMWRWKRNDPQSTVPERFGHDLRLDEERAAASPRARSRSARTGFSR
jgi:non-ribosomal peptide synthetase component F